MKFPSRLFQAMHARFPMSRSLFPALLFLAVQLFPAIQLFPAVQLFPAIQLQAQYKPFATPQILNFPYLETGGSEQNWDIVQDPEGYIYVANQDGDVLLYDGSAWQHIPVSEQGRVLSLAVDERGQVYAGAVGDFGLIESDGNGQMQYRSLCDTVMRTLLADEGFWNIVTHDTLVYYGASKHIATYKSSSGQVRVFTLNEAAVYPQLVDGQLYLPCHESGILSWSQDSAMPLPGGSFFRESMVLAMEGFDENYLLVCTRFDGLHLWNPESGEIREDFPSNTVQESLMQYAVVSAHADEHNVFLGTQFNGIYVLDKKGRLVDHFSTSNGLIDNTIAAIFAGSGKNRGKLWVAHWHGISMLDLGSPLQSHSFDKDSQSLSGRSTSGYITDISSFKGQLFISMSDGSVFRRLEGPGGISYEPVYEAGTAIFDLQVISPPGPPPSLLLLAEDNIIILDENMQSRLLSDILQDMSLSEGRPDFTGGISIQYHPDNPEIFFSGYDRVVGIEVKNNRWKQVLQSAPLEEPLTRMLRDQDGTLWLQGEERISHWDVNDPGKEPRIFGPEQGLPARSYTRLYRHPVSGEVWVGSKGGFFQYDQEKEVFVPDSLVNRVLPEGIGEIYAAHEDAQGELWISLETQEGERKNLVLGREGENYRIIHERQLKQLCANRAACEGHLNDGGMGTWFFQSNTLHHFNKALASEEAEAFACQIRRIQIDGDRVLYPGPGLSHDFPAGTKTIEISHNAPYHPGGLQTSYSYRLLNFDEEWSAWRRGNSSKITGLEHGQYEFQVKAQNLHGDISSPATFSFSIARPWYISVVAVILYVALAVFMVFFIYRYTQNLRKRAEILARKNREIAQQKQALEELNDEITTQRDEIEAQRDSITQHRDVIEAQKTAITDSIHYARRIQDAVLPSVEVMRYLLPKHFVFYRPQQIVSGDFFWIDQRGDLILLALGDCTGHGVPGAFMSMLGISILNEISTKNADRPTNEIMDELRDHVISSLGQTGEDYEQKDGMDMGLLAINTRTRMIQFTGAHHNLHLYRKGEYEEIKGDRMPVGIHVRAGKRFSAHDIQLEKGDTLYLFSDGFPDQFGGERGKKYGYRRLRALLGGLQEKIMTDQLTVIRDEFNTWKGEEEQVDDVLLIGIQL